MTIPYVPKDYRFIELRKEPREESIMDSMSAAVELKLVIEERDHYKKALEEIANCIGWQDEEITRYDMDIRRAQEIAKEALTQPEGEDDE